MGSGTGGLRITKATDCYMVVAKGALACLVSLLIILEVKAQELEPRAYWITPKASNAFYVGYTFLDGEVVFHPVLPFENVDAHLHSAFLGYYRALDFFGRSANFTLTLPYVWGTEEGLFLSEFHSARLSGLSDLQLLFSTNLLGAKTMTTPEFLEFREDPGTIVGASIRIRVPSGQYSSRRLVNVGTNRWAFKPQIGLIQPVRKRFLIELALGTWLYTDNREFLVDQNWSQDPLLSSEFHFVWRIRPAFWASFDVNYYYGGRATIGEEELPTIQGNSRFGGTISANWTRAKCEICSRFGLCCKAWRQFESLLRHLSTRVDLRAMIACPKVLWSSRWRFDAHRKSRGDYSSIEWLCPFPIWKVFLVL